MIVEVLGIGIPNKGAELMLIAVQQKIRSKYPDAKFVVEPNTDYFGRANHGLYQKFVFRNKYMDLSFIGDYLPAKIKSKFGILSEKDVDVILDTSGFAYGDQWSVNKLATRLGRIDKWKKDGKKVIILPQALGPFTKKGFDEQLKHIVPSCDLIFARDEISYKYIQPYSKDNVFQSCDFTNIVSLDGVSASPRDVCVIPNSKMIEMSSDFKTADIYLNQMYDMINTCIKHGRKPYFLLHEGKSDLDLVNQINDRLDSKIEIVKSDCPREIKKIIGCSNIVISSRFHGIVSALSQGIPTIGTGWSHKYEMLMRDYDNEKFLLDQSNSKHNELLIELFNNEKYKIIQNRINDKSHALKTKSMAMWNKVLDII